MVNLPRKISKNTVDKNVVLLGKSPNNGKYLYTCVEKPALKTEVQVPGGPTRIEQISKRSV